jgi:hypothetical protein
MVKYNNKLSWDLDIILEMVSSLSQRYCNLCLYRKMLSVQIRERDY